MGFTLNSAYIVGATRSDEFTFPVAVGPDLTFNGDTDVFVAKVEPSGATLAYAGYIGGDGYDWGFGIAIDEFGDTYVVGETRSSEITFPVAVGPDLSFNGVADAFVAKVAIQVNAPQEINIEGPITGLTDASQVFTATLTPVTTTLPLSYSWKAAGQPPVTHTGGLTDTAVFTWSVSGTQQITVTAWNTAGVVTDTHVITLYAPVSADFTATPTTGSTPLSVTFTNLSSGDFIDCLWDFGDGNTSTDCNLSSHLYTFSGVYTVMLTVEGPGGIDTIAKIDYIMVNSTLYLPVMLKP